MEQDNPLLNPKFGLNTDTPDIKGFLEWLYDPEVDKAMAEFTAEELSKENKENN